MGGDGAGQEAPRSARAGRLARWFGRDTLRRVAKASLFMVLVLAASWLASRLGVLPDVELVALDARMRFNRPRQNSPVVVVNITDSEYRTTFADKNSLNPVQVHRLLSAVARERPAVIGVDLDTSDTSFANFEVPADWPTVVWGRAALSQGGAKLQPQVVLGGRRPAPCSGIVAMQLDHDGVIRRYRRAFPAELLCDQQLCGQPGEAHAPRGPRPCEVSACPLPSFAWAILHAYSTAGRDFTPEDFEALKSSAREEEQLAVSFAPAEGPELPPRPDCAPPTGGPGGQDYQLSRRTQLTAGELLGSEGGGAAPTDFLPFEGKIVLVGGTYNSYAKDEHRTPLGVMPGVEVIAQVLETELEGGGLPEPNFVILGLLLFFDNLLLVLIFKSFERSAVRTLALSVAAIFVVALLCSAAAFRTPRFWVYFAPVLFIALILELYDHAKDYRDDLLRLLPGGEAGPEPRVAVEHYAGTLRDYAREKLAGIAGEQSEEGHRDVSESWDEFRTELQPSFLRAVLRSKFRGREVKREFYFYESVSGEKITVEAGAGEKD